MWTPKWALSHRVSDIFNGWLAWYCAHQTVQTNSQSARWDSDSNENHLIHLLLVHIIPLSLSLLLHLVDATAAAIVLVFLLLLPLQQNNLKYEIDFKRIVPLTNTSCLYAKQTMETMWFFFFQITMEHIKYRFGAHSLYIYVHNERIILPITFNTWENLTKMNRRSQPI